MTLHFAVQAIANSYTAKGGIVSASPVSMLGVGLAWACSLHTYLKLL